MNHKELTDLKALLQKLELECDNKDNEKEFDLIFEIIDECLYDIGHICMECGEDIDWIDEIEQGTEYSNGQFICDNCKK